MEEKIYDPGECYHYQLTLDKLLLTPKYYAPDQEIVYRDLSRHTYRTLLERIHREASGLENLGIKRGDTVCIFDYDSPRYLETYFAVPMMGAVMHMMNWRSSPEQILYMMNHAQDDAVLIHEDFLPVLEEIWDQLSTVKKVVLLSDSGLTPDTGIPIDSEYEAMLAGASSDYRFPELDEDSRASLFYTTGTTGLPKGVHFTHKQLMLHIMSAAIMTGSFHSIGRFHSNDVYMPITPMFHVHAWCFPYVATLLGVKQVYPGKYEPTKLLQLIRDEHVTFSHCVPTVLLMILSHPMAGEIDLGNWKAIIGGSMFPKGLAKQALDRGVQVFDGYGMSETCPLLCLANLKPHMMDWDNDQKSEILTKTGLPVPLADLRIVDKNGDFLPHDGKTAGELVARTPWATKSYWNEPEMTKELWRDGWLHTKDIAVIDNEGYVKVTDRLKDVIKTGGEWISSLDLENCASQHEAVSEAAAVGIPDEKWGERPVIMATLKEGFKGKVSADELKLFMKKFVDDGVIPKYGLPDRFELVDAIPKTSVGKFNKIEIRRIVAAA
ncbi:MAG: fatty acid--CoA ligase [Syntrophales bacterium]|jgi:fatty-acyl-CoA synthase|nr:fatty acid--CoA ligase [Syntrophales bacterium]MDY0043584.1 fatty acid--CoA ligase [Syntrophales bacterium]